MSNTATNHGSCCTTAVGNSRHIDPVCGMSIGDPRPDLHFGDGVVDYYFCSKSCLKIFRKRLKESASGRESGSMKNRAVPAGLLGGAALLAVFITAIAVISINSNVEFAISEFKRLWYWALMLAAGFGFQLGLFVHIRHILQQRLTSARAELAASGSVSAGSMIACCSHALVTLLPFLGISAAAAFLARYQLSFLILGLFSNLLGVTVMIGLAQKNHIAFQNPVLKSVAGLNMNVLRIFLTVTGLLAIAVSFASS